MKSAYVGGCLSILLTGLMVSCDKNSAGKETTSQSDAEQSELKGQKEVPKKTAHNEQAMPAPPTKPAEVNSKSAPQPLTVPAPRVPNVVEAGSISEMEPIIVTDLKQIKLYPGSEGPRVGEKVYTHKSLPKDACGTYWVENDDGFVESFSVCTADHSHDE